MSQPMTVADLLQVLEDYDPDMPVMIAHQPSWPLAEVLTGVCHASDLDEPASEGEGLDCLWLVAGGHAWDRSPYAPGWVFEGAW